MGLALRIAQNCIDIPHSLSLSTEAAPMPAKKSAPDTNGASGEPAPSAAATQIAERKQLPDDERYILKR
jgi:hypothetical protein